MKTRHLKAVILVDEAGSERRINLSLDDLRGDVEQLNCNDYEIILEALTRTDLSIFCSPATAVDLIAKLKPMRDRACRV